MEFSKALEVLRLHQKWRKGEIEEMPFDAKDLTEAIDAILLRAPELLEKVGIQKLEQPDNFVFAPIDGDVFNWGDLAENDGLSFEYFQEWFKVRHPEPMAIIHFTDFRYLKNR